MRADAGGFLAGGRGGGADFGGGLVFGLDRLGSGFVGLTSGFAGFLRLAWACTIFGRDSSSAFSAVTMMSPRRWSSMLSARRRSTAQLSLSFLQAQDVEARWNLKAVGMDA